MILAQATGSHLVTGRARDSSLDSGMIVLSSSMTIVGFAIVAAFFANVVLTVARASEVGRTNAKNLMKLQDEMAGAQIPKELREKVEATYEYLWKFGMQKNSMLQDPSLSLDLRRSLAWHTYGACLRKVPIFASVSDVYLRSLAQRVELRLYTPGDCLMIHGEVGTELFILKSGTVRAFDEAGNPCGDMLLGEGDFLGEICFLNPGTRRQATVKCVEFCVAMVLTLAVFTELNLYQPIQAIRKTLGQIRGTMIQSAAT